MKIKVLDLFSGIGMFSYGLEKTGKYETVAFCEWDEKCQQILKNHWPNIHCYGDTSDLKYRNGYLYSNKDEAVVFTDIDVICGGFPCQDISNSGPKTGLSGSRSGYWSSMLKLIDSVKPKGVIIENVSALFNRGFMQILQELSKIGYDAEWHVIPASNCGAIHQRKRVFILAYSASLRQQGPWKFFKPFDSEAIRNRQAGIVKYALERGPLPYLCRDHDVCPGRMDRIKQVGNTVYWPIVQRLGEHMYDNIRDSL